MRIPSHWPVAVGSFLVGLLPGILLSSAGRQPPGVRSAVETAGDCVFIVAADPGLGRATSVDLAGGEDSWRSRRWVFTFRDRDAAFTAYRAAQDALVAAQRRAESWP